MKNVEIVIRSYLPILYVSLLIPFVSFSQTITFDDTAPEIMVLDNGSSYEITLSKLTGAIAYIKDKAADVKIVSGGGFDILWSVDYMDGSSVRSHDFYPDEPNDFKVNAIVTITLYDSGYFDMQIHIDNKGIGII